MTGYYDYAVRRPLQQPVVLSGFFGSNPERVGHTVGALSGLPFLCLAQLVEHRAGVPIADILARHGRSSLDALEAECLQEQLPRKPYPLIAVAETTVLGPAQLAQLRGKAHHVHLSCGLVESYWRVRRELQRAPSRFQPYLSRPPSHPDELESLYAARSPGYRAANVTVPVAGLDTLESARAVLALLEDE